jgi:hypothetical protein
MTFKYVAITFLWKYLTLAITWKMMKEVVITFFDIMGTVHFEFIPHGQQSTKLKCGNNETVT